MRPADRNPLTRWTHQLWQVLLVIAFLPAIVVVAVRLAERVLPIVLVLMALLLILRWIVSAVRRRREWSDW